MTNRRRSGREHELANRLLDDIARLRTDVSTRVHALIDRTQLDTAPDGYPRRASGAEPGTRGTSVPAPRIAPCDDDLGVIEWTCAVPGCQHAEYASTETDAARQNAAHWREHHDPTLDYTDPTGDAAVTSDDHRAPDPLHADLRRVLRHLATARLELDRAAQVTRATTTPPMTTDPDVWCRNHLTAGLHEPIARHSDGRRRYEDLCRFCGDFLGEQRVLPTPKLLRIRADKGRVYDRDVQQALTEARAQTGRTSPKVPTRRATVPAQLESGGGVAVEAHRTTWCRICDQDIPVPNGTEPAAALEEHSAAAHRPASA